MRGLGDHVAGRAAMGGAKPRQPQAGRGRAERASLGNPRRRRVGVRIERRNGRHVASTPRARQNGAAGWGIGTFQCREGAAPIYRRRGCSARRLWRRGSCGRGRGPFSRVQSRGHQPGSWCLRLSHTKAALARGRDRRRRDGRVVEADVEERRLLGVNDGASRRTGCGGAGWFSRPPPGAGLLKLACGRFRRRPGAESRSKTWARWGVSRRRSTAWGEGAPQSGSTGWTSHGLFLNCGSAS